jgi:hypothetical protein
VDFNGDPSAGALLQLQAEMWDRPESRILEMNSTVEAEGGISLERVE